MSIMSSRVRNTFAALQHPNYRLWFTGQIVSLFGTWMQTTAQGFLVYELTGSPAMLGYVTFANGIPTWIFTLYAGVIADRIPRRTMLIITQVSMMILAFILAGLTFSGLIQPWQIILMAFLLGVANSFDAPARQSFVRELVDTDDLTNAIALNSSMFNTASAVGPAIAGVAYALAGPGWCFAINGLSFIAVIINLLRIRITPTSPPPQPERAFSALKEGLHFTFSNPTVRIIIITIGMVSLFGMSFATLLPAWAVNVLHGDVTTNGLLRSAQGAGALIGALVIASLGRFRYRGKLLTIGSLVFPTLLLVFSFVRNIPLGLVILAGVGTASIFVLNLANALVQSTVPDELRGRVMSIYTLTFFGLNPLGGLLAGSIAEAFNEQIALIIGCGAMLVYSLTIIILVPRFRKIP